MTLSCYRSTAIFIKKVLLGKCIGISFIGFDENGSVHQNHPNKRLAAMPRDRFLEKGRKVIEPKNVRIF